MIHKASKTNLDREHLTHHKNKIFLDSGIEYRDVVVNKPWGYEYLLFKNQHVEIWILFVNNGHATSMHCHRNKQTSLSVLAGSAQFSTLKKEIQLKPFDSVLIAPGAFHSTRATSDGAIVMEVETPPNKSDIIRLKDLYGREDAGYEGVSSVSQELHKYAHCYFDAEAKTNRRDVGGRSFGVGVFNDLKQLQNHIHEHQFGLIVILGGRLIGSGGAGINPGEILTSVDLDEYLKNNYSIDAAISVLTVF